MPRSPEYVNDGDAYELSERPAELDGIVPIGTKKNIKFRTREGGQGTKEKVVGKYRACMVCRVIASETQFFEGGCPNCPFLEMQGSRSTVWDCTSTKFSGMIAIMRPDISWAAKFNGLARGVPGCYAVEVHGELSERVRDLINRP